MSSLLIVAAVKFEAQVLLDFLDENKCPYTFFETGIGPLEAAKSAAKLEETCEGAKVVYLGSCGSFRPFKEPYLIGVRETYWMPAGVRAGISDFNEDWYPSYHFKQSLPEVQKLEQGVILTSPEISTTKTIKRKSLQEDPSVYFENMELYALAPAFQKAKELTLILGVTNEINANSRSQWREHFKKISVMTTEFLGPLMLKTYKPLPETSST